LSSSCSHPHSDSLHAVLEFLAGAPHFAERDAAEAAIASGALTPHGADIVRKYRGPAGSVRLTPRRAGTDGFFFALLERRA
jgi:16S rRNA (cytosine967-C5)-methyltransferase